MTEPHRHIFVVAYAEPLCFGVEYAKKAYLMTRYCDPKEHARVSIPVNELEKLKLVKVRKCRVCGYMKKMVNFDEH